MISAQWYFYILYCHSTSTDDMSTLPHLLGDLVNEGRSKGRPKSGHAQRGLHITLSIVPNENGLQAGPLARVIGRTRCGVKTSGSKQHQILPARKTQQRVNYLDMFGPQMTATVKFMSLAHINYNLCCLHVLQPFSFVAFVPFLQVEETTSASQGPPWLDPSRSQGLLPSSSAWSCQIFGSPRAAREADLGAGRTASLTW